jgi:hypothetical protein
MPGANLDPGFAAARASAGTGAKRQRAQNPLLPPRIAQKMLPQSLSRHGDAV